MRVTPCSTYHVHVHVHVLVFYLCSLHAIQRTHVFVSNASDTDTVGTGLTFPRDTTSSCMRVARLLPRSVANMPSRSNVHANDILRQMRHPIPPPP